MACGDGKVSEGVNSTVEVGGFCYLSTEDIVPSQPSFRSHLCSPRAHVIFHGKTFCSFHFQKEARLGSARKNNIQLPGKIIFKEASLQKHNVPVIKSIATLEAKCLDGTEDGYGWNPSFQHDSDFRNLQPSTEGEPEMDEREKSRRMKISKANKGNVPWNKGRKHSPETLQKIRERTRIAMQDPKVKMKLVNMGHAQSEETRRKIGTGVRQGWQRRRERLLVQETCCLEWQNIIAEASRKGYSGDDELQWNSYEILDKQLKKEWLESVEKRKTMARPKGGKRAPKSPEQRKKIAEAISAKWNDPEYRNRVCSALAKYHGVPVGAQRKQRRKMADKSQPVERRSAKKKSREAKDTSAESKMIKKVTQKKRKTSAPLFRDPMSSSKWEMIKKIREERAEMEAKKREATERAMLLVAEAEKAAKALEAAALKSPLAQASLLEARKLIAEATRSIESIGTGQFASQESGSCISLELNKTVVDSHGGPRAFVGNTLDGRPVNGRSVRLPNRGNGDGSNYSDFIKPNSWGGGEPLSMVEGKSSVEGPHSSDGVSSLSNGEGNRLDVMLSGLDSSLNGSVSYINNSKDKWPSESRKNDAPITYPPKTKKVWIRGRLVEVGEL